jgi:hypothetical protein
MVEEFKLIDTVLKDAEQYNMQVDVVYYALKHMKEDPKLTITQAIMLSHDEFIK